MSCTVRILYYDNRDSPITVLPCMCITQETFINIVMSWYDHYCADANIFILSYLPCWSCIFFTIAFIMWKSFVCKFVLLMLNKFILVHKWFIWMVVICHVFYCILCCICIFYHVLCQKWQNKAVKSIFILEASCKARWHIAVIFHCIAHLSSRNTQWKIISINAVGSHYDIQLPHITKF